MENNDLEQEFTEDELSALSFFLKRNSRLLGERLDEWKEHIAMTCSSRVKHVLEDSYTVDKETKDAIDKLLLLIGGGSFGIK